MFIPTGQGNVNNQKVRYALKSGYGWVVARDIASQIEISTQTLMRYASPLMTTSHQIELGEYRAKGIRSDILIDTINRLLTVNKWEHKYRVNPQFRTRITSALAFLEDLGNKALNQSDDLSALRAKKELVQGINELKANGTYNATLSAPKHESNKGDDAVTPLNWCFDSHIIRFVGTVDVLKWVVNDIIAILYPASLPEDYNQYLDSVDVRCLSSIKINIVNNGITSIDDALAIDEVGIYRLIARSDSPIAGQLQYYISRSISTFIDATNETPKAKSNGKVIKLVADDDDVVTPIDFDYMGHIIRFVGTPEKLEWVANDPIAILHPDADKENYYNYREKVDDEWKGNKKIITPGGVQKVVTFYEPGLYQFMARSNSSLAFPFQKWIFETVLPSIRKTGSYTAPGTSNSTNQLPFVQDGTFEDDAITKYAQLARELVNATNEPLAIKSLNFVRAIRNQFPHVKSFHNLYDAIATQDLMQYEEQTHHSYHAIPALATCYASKHKLGNILNPMLIQQALVDKNLMYKDDWGGYMPTELGKNYSVLGWDKEPDGTLKPAIRWRQEVLLLLGTLH